MSDIPQTFAQWSAYGALKDSARVVINTLIEDRPLLGILPIEQWPGTEDYTWILNKTLPTITWEAETATHESTQAKRYRMRTYLAYGHGDVEIPIHSSSTMDAAMSMEAEDALDLIRNMGISISGKLFTGAYMTTGSATIVGTGLAATPYIDAVTDITENMGTGMGGLKYVHSGTWVQFKAPGGTTWGTAVATASDGDYTYADGDDPNKKITLTIDVTDLAADWESGAALVFGLPTNIAGLRGLAVLDSAQIPTIETNGAAITLAQLDELDEMVLGPKSEKIYLMNARTRRAVKSLIAGAGGTRPAEFQDGTIDKNSLAYEKVRIIADSNISITETQGSATSSCGSVYCLRLNKEVGYHLIAGAHRGPNSGVMSAVSDHDSAGGPVQLPVYMRRLEESYTDQQFKWRISIGMASALKRSKSCAIRYGVTS